MLSNVHVRVRRLEVVTWHVGMRAVRCCLLTFDLPLCCGIIAHHHEEDLDDELHLFSSQAVADRRQPILRQ